jgi:hypothetical protein
MIDDYRCHEKIVNFEARTAVSVKVMIIWEVSPCSLVETYRFREMNRLPSSRRKSDVH